MRLALALVLSSSAILIAPRSASADCASPHPTLSPAAGTTLPPDPTLYLFIPTETDRPSEIRVRATAGGEELPIQVSLASRTAALTVVRITIRTGAHRAITVEPLASRLSWTADFAIGSASRVERATVGLRSARHERDEWTCSFTDAWLLAPDAEADVYRVEWAATPSAWERGEQSSAIFPRNELDLWSPPYQDTPRRPSIALGHVSCFTYTIPEEAVRGPLYVKLSGLYADGSETPAWSKPRRLDAGELQPPPAVTQTATVPAPAPTSAPIATTQPAASTSGPRGATGSSVGSRMAAPACLAGLILVVAVLRRRRARATRVASPPR